jgi:predicted Zn-dependent protease
MPFLPAPRSGRVLVLLALAAMHCHAVLASPYRPGNDSEILEQLPERPFGPSRQHERALRELIAQQPDPLDLAVRMAAIEVRRSLIGSDPRPLGQAEALLAPWWNEQQPPVPVLLLRATIRQRSHDFAPARADLYQAVRREPDNAQAWLSLASIEQVTGNFEAADRACAHLPEIASALVAQLCRAALDGVRGRADAASANLTNALARATPGERDQLRDWVFTLRAELAERRGRADEAARFYQASLAVNPDDTYTIAAYADYLLDAGRAEDVIGLIAAGTPVDTLLLRRAQAARRLNRADAQALIADLDARFAASRERGDRVHLREEARYRLELAGDPIGALELAGANWRVQKEPLDARILLECAIAAGRPEAAAEVIAWIRRNNLESPMIARLVAQAEGA